MLSFAAWWDVGEQAALRHLQQAQARAPNALAITTTILEGKPNYQDAAGVFGAMLSMIYHASPIKMVRAIKKEWNSKKAKVKAHDRQQQGFVGCDLGSFGHQTEDSRKTEVVGLVSKLHESAKVNPKQQIKAEWFVLLKQKR